MIWSTILYANPFWYSGKVVIAKRLLNTQRSLILYVTKCYAKISTDVLHVLAVILPLDLRAEMDMDLMVVIRWQKITDSTGLVAESVDL